MFEYFDGDAITREARPFWRRGDDQLSLLGLLVVVLFLRALHALAGRRAGVR